MKSHEFAHKLQGIAELLLAKPEFETQNTPRIHLFFWSEKNEFLAAVKALGAGEKKWTKDDFEFIPAGCPENSALILNIYRNAVCRKVQDEKRECDPLLSSDEEARVGTEAE